MSETMEHGEALTDRIIRTIRDEDAYRVSLRTEVKVRGLVDEALRRVAAECARIAESMNHQPHGVPSPIAAAIREAFGVKP
jgi:hypothetical protein